ncbi:MAG: signal recognition particle-docking protein FtsY [Ruminococcus flavefaciens]|jgi:signal recognition particle-docking protein FtsY|nr:signal recognition particle-docking protein FtsY [Ruminococcus flavefaciens]
MGIIAKIAAGLRKTRDSFINSLRRITNSFTKIDEDLFEALEEAMIMSDIGVETSEEICDRLRKKIKERGITDPAEIMELIHEVIGEIMGDDTGLDLSVSPAVIMVIGVNGAGKTTTIGKLCHQFKNEGKKVIVAAADTFRAAAIDQLQVWTDRAGVDIVKHAEGSDPGAVVYDALEAAKARGCDVVIIDTAGRLHNKKNLMDELAKINRIIDSKAGDCSREVLLVLDATTGQNAVNQAKLFSETAPISGIVLTKLDGTAKGGIVISIKNELGIPVKLIGVGEKIDDLQPFDSRTFVEALFSDVETEEAEAEEDTELEGEDSGEETEYQEDEAAEEAYEEEDPAEAETEDAEADEPENEEPEVAAPETYEENAAETAEEENETEDAPEPVEEDGELISQTGYSYNENYMDNWQEEHSDILDGGDEESDEASEPEEETEEEEVQPEKKKKRGFFSRLFGRKKYEEEEEETESEDEDSEDEETDNGDE